MFRPDSSTESNNDQSSPVDRRINTPRHLGGDKRGNRSRNHQLQTSAIDHAHNNVSKENHSMDLICPGSNNR